jgi:hypothetical protein
MDEIVQPHKTMDDLDKKVNIARIGGPKVTESSEENAKHPFHENPDLAMIEVERFLPGVRLMQIHS